MKRAGTHWHKTLLNRFADREDIGKDNLYEQYFSDLPRADVFEFFDLIEFEYEIPAGLLMVALRRKKVSFRLTLPKYHVSLRKRRRFRCHRKERMYLWYASRRRSMETAITASFHF